MRAAGDLVARLEMAKGMRLAEAKQTVASALGVAVPDLADPLAMHEVRGELDVALPEALGERAAGAGVRCHPRGDHGAAHLFFVLEIERVFSF